MPRRPRGRKLFTPEEQALIDRQRAEDREDAAAVRRVEADPTDASIPWDQAKKELAEKELEWARAEHDKAARVAQEQTATLQPGLGVGGYANLSFVTAFEWAQLAKVGKILRRDLSDTQAALIVLKGGELGIPPLRALAHIYLAPTSRDGDQYEFVLQAELMRALVLERGLGAIEPLPAECTEDVGVVRAIRKDFLGERSTKFSYSIADARRDGLLLHREWASGVNQMAKLIARATSMAWRAWFADAASGLGYAPEDLPPGAGAAPVNPSPDLPVAAREAAPEPSLPLPPASPPAATPPESVGAAVAPSAAASAGPAGPKEKRTRWFHAGDAPGDPEGSPPRKILTNGITFDTMRGILNYSLEARGYARWQEARDVVFDYLDDLGIEERSVMFLTADEGAALMVMLAKKFGFGGTRTVAPPASVAPPPAAVVPPPAQPATVGLPTDTLTDAVQGWLKAKATFEDMIQRRHLEGYRTTLERIVCMTSNVNELAEVDPEKWNKTTADLDGYAQDGVVEQIIHRLKDRFEKEGSGATS